jgi:hypothetical protein
MILVSIPEDIKVEYKSLGSQSNPSAPLDGRSNKKQGCSVTTAGS